MTVQEGDLQFFWAKSRDAVEPINFRLFRAQYVRFEFSRTLSRANVIGAPQCIYGPIILKWSSFVPNRTNDTEAQLISNH